MKITKDITKKVLKKYWFQFFWIVVLSTVLGFFLTIIQPTKYLTQIDLLIISPNAEATTEALNIIVKSDNFYKLVLEKSKNQDNSIEKKIKNHKEWQQNIKTQRLANNQALRIKTLDQDKKTSIDITNIIKETISENKAEYFYNPETINIKILNPPSTVTTPNNYHTIFYVSGGLLIGFLMAYMDFRFKARKFIYKKFRKKKFIIQAQRRHHKKLLPQKKYLRDNAKEKTSTEKTTEQEVKNKLNRLIRGENILSSTNNNHVARK